MQPGLTNLEYDTQVVIFLLLFRTMSTNVTTNVSFRHYEQQRAPHENLKCLVNSTGERIGQEFEGPANFLTVLKAGDNTQVKVTEQINVGPTPLVMVWEVSSISQFMTETKAAIAQLRGSIRTLARPRVSVAGACIFQVISGCGSFGPTETSRLRSLGPDHPTVQKLSELAGETAENIALQGDKVVERRNNIHAHFPSVEALDAEVKSCQQLVHDHPELKQEMRWESWAIQNYDALKEAFKDLFLQTEKSCSKKSRQA